MEDNFASRLKLFIDTNGLTSSQFADMCGIPRPSLSQVLSGRNKKISDGLVKQIHDAFPDVSVLWLMFGEGPVKIAGADPSLGVHPISEGVSVASAGQHEANSLNTEFENPVNPQNGTASPNRGNLVGLGIAKNDDNHAKNQIFESDLKILDLQRQIDNLRQNPRKVIQITIYYDDSTFETFVPKG